MLFVVMREFGWTWQDIRSTPDDVLLRAIAFVQLREREQHDPESLSVPSPEAPHDDAE